LCCSFCCCKDFGFLGSWRQRPRLRPPRLPAADDIPVPTVSISFRATGSADSSSVLPKFFLKFNL